MKTQIKLRLPLCVLLIAMRGSELAAFPSLLSDLYSNSGFGSNTLAHLTSGSCNTAAGDRALFFNTFGLNNTALGCAALYNSTSGNNNTATGNLALSSNTSGQRNTASGSFALYFNRGGHYNTASGYQSLRSNTTANYNTASGADSLFSNTFGSNNTALGFGALVRNTTGHDNIAIGSGAGKNLTTGSNNIFVGSYGLSGDSKTIRLGRNGLQTATFVAGIYGKALVGQTVVVNSNGRLGVTGPSSARFKTDIAPMPRNTDKLAQLRPVTFAYKDDSEKLRQYGLIAEEVAKVYPELVIHGEGGSIDGVRYDQLVPMLLKESQAQATEIRDLKNEVAEMRKISAEMQTALQLIQANARQVAGKYAHASSPTNPVVSGVLPW